MNYKLKMGVDGLRPDPSDALLVILRVFEYDHPENGGTLTVSEKFADTIRNCGQGMIIPAA